MLPPKLCSIAGKVILLGEYAVLTGCPALVAAVPPRFEWVEGTDLTVVLVPGSPLGRYQPEFRGTIHDPHFGAGGFGASTAEFALAYFTANPGVSPSWKAAWQAYRDLYQNERTKGAVLPSGADLVAQWEGGVVYFEPSESASVSRCEQVWDAFDWSRLMVFSAAHQANRKVPTHRHLQSLCELGFPHSYADTLTKLGVIIRSGMNAVRENHTVGLGHAMTAYAETLYAAGLELDATTEDRRVIASIPGVVGVKGSGALQADAIVVLVDRGEDGDRARTGVLELAAKRGLKLITPALDREMGVQWES